MAATTQCPRCGHRQSDSGAPAAGGIKCRKCAANVKNLPGGLPPDPADMPTIDFLSESRIILGGILCAIGAIVVVAYWVDVEIKVRHRESLTAMLEVLANRIVGAIAGGSLLIIGTVMLATRKR